MGVTVDFAPSKLKQGHGEQAIFVLDRLSDEALRASQFQWFKPSGIPEEGGDDEEDVEDEAELNLDKVEEEMAAEYSDEEDEDDILHINGEKIRPSALDINTTYRGTTKASERPTKIGGK